VFDLDFNTARICPAALSGRRCPPLAETPHVQTRLAEGGRMRVALRQRWALLRELSGDDAYER
jgi:hypothetical protein